MVYFIGGLCYSHWDHVLIFLTVPARVIGKMTSNYMSPSGVYTETWTWIKWLNMDFEQGSLSMKKIFNFTMKICHHAVHLLSQVQILVSMCKVFFLLSWKIGWHVHVFLLKYLPIYSVKTVVLNEKQFCPLGDIGQLF